MKITMTRKEATMVAESLDTIKGMLNAFGSNYNDSFYKAVSDLCDEARKNESYEGTIYGSETELNVEINPDIIDQGTDFISKYAPQWIGVMMNIIAIGNAASKDIMRISEHNAEKQKEFEKEQEAKKKEKEAAERKAKAEEKKQTVVKKTTKKTAAKKTTKKSVTKPEAKDLVEVKPEEKPQVNTSENFNEIA